MSALQTLSSPARTTEEWSLPFAVPPAPRRPAWQRAGKRGFDLAVASLALLVAAPIVAVAALAIVAITGGSPWYVQERVGMNGRRFRMFKLRTMVRDAHARRDEFAHLNEVDGPFFKIRKDPRLHPVGALLRRLSIDELPNFVNVLLGQMSVVGPRPPLPEEVAHYDEFAMRRLCVPPGVTCLWQISGRSALSFDEWMELDNRYIDSWTIAGDLRIVLRTVPEVLGGTGAH
jgi:lipopolysaccharide/colanic/teichoic acid biosynthesis glycosyltransferase